jgi:ribosomal biogenesis protein LAS1
MLEMCLLTNIFSFSVYKKQITKSLKILVRLYSSFSMEVVSILLEFLLKAINSSDLVDLQEDSQVGPIMHTLLDDWKLVITKLSNKEPELLLTLLKAVLDMIETQKAMENETGNFQLSLCMRCL